MTVAIYSLWFALSAYGYGTLLVPATTGDRNGVSTIVYGLTVLIFIGGLLNLARLAVPGALFVVMALGGMLAAVSIYRTADWRHRPVAARAWRCWPAWAVGIAYFLFLVSTAALPRALNYHDDFAKYLAAPLRMLQTGTLFGGPLFNVGVEHFGALSFLQGFFVAVFGPASANAVDAVVAATLILALAGWQLANAGVDRYLAMIVLIALATINPMQVNVSSLYTSALLVIQLGLARSDADHAVSRHRNQGAEIRCGLIYATLLLLKSTNLIFVVCHLAFRLLSDRTARPLIGAAVMLLALLPWLVGYLSTLGTFEFIGASAGDLDLAPGLAPSTWHAALSSQPLTYGFGGTSPLQMGAIVAASLLATLAVALRERGRRDHPSAMRAVGACTASYLLLAFPLQHAGVGIATNLRLAIPYLLAGVAVALLSLARPTVGTDNAGRPRVRPLVAVLLVAASTAVAQSYAGSAAQRAVQLALYGHQLAFSRFANSPANMAYNTRVLRGDGQAMIAAAQDRVPPGETLLAVTSLGAFLDFDRNPVHLHVDVAVLAPHLAFDRRAGELDWDAVVGRLGIRYLVWQHAGFGIADPIAVIARLQRSPEATDRALGRELSTFDGWLRSVSQRGELLLDGPEWRVIRLPR